MSSQQGYGSVENGKPQEERFLISQESQDEREPAWYTWLNKARFAIALMVLGSVCYWAIPSAALHAPSDNDDDYKGPRFPSTVKRYYKQQTLDHFNTARGANKNVWKQRYYEDHEFFGGPGSPLFIILGGEDAVHRILYPFISRVLGERFKAHTVCLEHRFYGSSLPMERPTNGDLQRLLHPRQALADAVQFIRYKQTELGCGPRGSPTYCPVMTVGASYPGFLSALMRIVHDDVVDIGYASSAPLYLYSHQVSKTAYYEKVTASADTALSGCASAVKTTLQQVQLRLEATRSSGLAKEAQSLGICPKTIPAYINTTSMLAQELNMVIATHFADANMAYYPPRPDQELVVACEIFTNTKLSAASKIHQFLTMDQDFKGCFDLQGELPPGPNATISAADWSGVGGGPAGYAWDYQSCTLIPECSITGMFPERDWTIDWLTSHCQSRFDYTPVETALVDEFHFDDLYNTTRLLFTNGLQDGWSVASITAENENEMPGVQVVNMENGAHHSDLSHMGPTDEDTPDVKTAHVVIGDLVETWLNEVRAEQALE
jgi:Serine carboxypeptidase S28